MVQDLPPQYAPVNTLSVQKNKIKNLTLSNNHGRSNNINLTNVTQIFYINKIPACEGAQNQRLHYYSRKSGPAKKEVADPKNSERQRKGYEVPKFLLL